MGDSTPFPSPAAIARAELFTRERFVYDGETLEEALSPGSARRRALDAALAEIDADGLRPSIEWRRHSIEGRCPSVSISARAASSARRRAEPGDRASSSVSPS